MNQDPDFCMWTLLMDTIIDAKIRSRTSLSSLCLIIEVYHMFLFDTKFDAYARSLSK